MKNISHNIWIRFILACLFFAVVTTVYIFAYNLLRNINEATSKTQQLIALELSKKENAGTLQRVVAETKVEREKLSTYFVTQDQIVSFIDTIEKYKDVTGATVTFSTVDYNKNTKNLSLALVVRGTFSQVYQTLLLLENAPYEFAFDKINLTAQAPVSVVTAPNIPNKDEHGLKTDSKPKPLVQAPPTIWEANLNLRLLSFIPN